MIKGKNFETLTTDRLIRCRLIQVPLYTSHVSEQSSSRLAFHCTSIYYSFVGAVEEFVKSNSSTDHYLRRMRGLKKPVKKNLEIMGFFVKFRKLIKNGSNIFRSNEIHI